MKREKNLPKKLSDCIAIGLKDLAAVERSKKYEVEMDSSWHEPRYETGDYNHNTGGYDTKAVSCAVCFAGSVMAMTMGAKLDESLKPFSFGKHNEARFNALNYIREGYIGEALQELGKLTPFGLARVVEITPYDLDPKGFKKDMRKISKLLRACGE